MNIFKKKALTQEEIDAQQAKKEAREKRWENFKDGFVAVSGAMLPIFGPIFLLAGASAVASKKNAATQNEAMDRLAQGYGYADRTDPGFVRKMYEDSMTDKRSIDADDEE